MPKLFSEFILRFGHHRGIRKPLGSPPCDTLKLLYEEFGTGWSANYLINIIEPAFIPDINTKVSIIKSLNNKTPFAFTSLGTIFLLNQCQEVEAFDPYTNTLNTLGNSIEITLNQILFQNSYHSILAYEQTKKLTSELGPLPVESIYQIDCLPLFIPLSKSTKFKVAPLYNALEEWAPLLSISS